MTNDRQPPTEIDSAALEARALELASRYPGIAADSARFSPIDERRALDLAIRAIDLTTLEGDDSDERVRRLCARAMRPDPADESVPPVAAVCVYPVFVATAVRALAGSSVRVASVAGAFPSGQSFRETKLDEVRRAVDAGANELDVPMSRTALLAGEHARAFDELAAVKAAAGAALLKVILEVGELRDYDTVLLAARIALDAGADFVKTSTGKIAQGATLPVVLLLLEAVRDFERTTGRTTGVKAAGGIRTAQAALGYLALADHTLGRARTTPARFRIGASALLDDLVERRRRAQAP